MPRPARETIMQAYLAAMVAATQSSFNADTRIGSNTLLNVNNLDGTLFLGLPIFGAGIPPMSLITDLSPLTMSQPATANASQSPMENGVLTFGRRVIPWDECQAQPALFVRDPDERAEYGTGILQQLSIEAEVWIYSNLGANPAVAPVTGLNNLIDAVQGAMSPDDPMQQRYTIGGLVFWCRLKGRLMKDPGDADGQAIAKIPVEILVP
jgi:hypothetical protein